MNFITIEFLLSVFVALTGCYIAGVINPSAIRLSNYSRAQVLIKGFISLGLYLAGIAFLIDRPSSAEIIGLSAFTLSAILIALVVLFSMPIWSIYRLYKQPAISVEDVNINETAPLEETSSPPEEPSIAVVEKPTVNKAQNLTLTSERSQSVVENKRSNKGKTEAELLDEKIAELEAEANSIGDYRENIVWIDYENYDGELTFRKIEYKSTDGNLFNAYCFLRDDIRSFSFNRIHNIADRKMSPIGLTAWIQHRSVYAKQSKKSARHSNNQPLKEITFTGFAKS